MNEFYRSVGAFVELQTELPRTLKMARPPDVDSDSDSFAAEQVSAQDDKAVAAIFRLLERNIYRRVWYLEQMLTATRELSGQLNLPNDHLAVD